MLHCPLSWVTISHPVTACWRSLPFCCPCIAAPVPVPQVVGNSKAAIVDTWWQTETGAHMITPLPGATPVKPGSATLPFFGVEPALLDDKGNEVEGVGQG
jgi:hypothetical protein